MILTQVNLGYNLFGHPVFQIFLFGKWDFLVIFQTPCEPYILVTYTTIDYSHTFPARIRTFDNVAYMLGKCSHQLLGFLGILGLAH